MANVRSGNTWYADTTGSLTTTGKNLVVTHIIMTSISTNVVFAISDGSSAKLSLRCPTTTTTALYDFSDSPLVFTTSINITAVANIRATFLLQDG